jgi:acyl-coenzyme A synthetase/AMP-(fatty) acid ligase
MTLLATAATESYPFLRHDDGEALFAVQEGRNISVAEFLRDTAVVASTLPPRRYVANLCADRYRFTVGVAAALLREQISLMPPNQAPAVLEELAADFPDLYCIHDGLLATGRLPAVAFPDQLPEDTQAPRLPTFPSEQPAIVLFTSGSTGRPKAHQKSWGALVDSAVAAGKRLGVDALKGGMIVGTVPQQHSYGFESTVLLALQHGFALHGARPFYPADIVTCLAETAHPRILVTTPIHLRALLAEASMLPSVDLVISATAPLARQLAADAEQRFQAPLVEIYGCSEAGQLATRKPVETEEWRCLDTIRLRQDASGTWAFQRSSPDAVLLNDVLELHGPERFLLHGRSQDLVNIAGKRTSLAHLNHHLNSIRGVVDGVFLMPEEGADATTRLMAYVVAPSLSREAIMAALRQRLDPAFLPRPLVMVDSLLRNPVGKLSYDVLRRMATERSR